MRCGTSGEQTHSCYVPHLAFSDVTCSLLTSPPSFVNPLIDECLYKQHSWLLCQQEQAPFRFFKASLFGKHGMCALSCCRRKPL